MTQVTGNQVESWTLQIIFGKPHLKTELWNQLIKTLSHTASAYSYPQDCFIYVFANHGKDQFKNKIEEIFSKLLEEEWGYSSYLEAECFWNKCFPKKTP